MVDPGRVRALLDRLKEESSHLRRLSRLPDEDLLADPDRMAAIKYRFVVAIETCIDVGQHVIASEGLRAPADYADVFAVLAEAGYVAEEEAVSLRNMGRFRNLLVHGYSRVEALRVIEILRTRVDDLDSFRLAIAAKVSPSNDTQPDEAES